MSVLLLMSFAMSLLLNLVLLRWALRERQLRHRQQAQLQQLRHQMLFGDSGASTGRWFIRFMVLMVIFWSLAVYLW